MRKKYEITLALAIGLIAGWILASTDNGSDYQIDLEDQSKPEYMFTRMHVLTVNFCHQIDSSACEPLPPLKLTFPYEKDCSIAMGNITSGYERSPSFDITDPATCEPTAILVEAFRYQRAAEEAFGRPEFGGLVDFSNQPLELNQIRIAGGGFAREVIGNLEARDIDFMRADVNDGFQVVLTFDREQDKDLASEIIDETAQEYFSSPN